MRSLLLLSLAGSLALAAGAVHAQSGYGTFAPHKSPPPKIGGGDFAPLPGSAPYKPHAAPAAPKAPGNTDGGEAFKPYEPYKPTSIYSPPKPAKPKGLYDR